MIHVDLATGSSFKFINFIKLDVDQLDLNSKPHQPKRQFQTTGRTSKIVLYLSFLVIIVPLTFLQVIKEMEKCHSFGTVGYRLE